MKAIILSIAVFISLGVSAQKKDTTVQITLTVNQYKGLMYAIDQNIDSKKTSKEIMDFIDRSAKIVIDSTDKKQAKKEK